MVGKMVWCGLWYGVVCGMVWSVVWCGLWYGVVCRVKCCIVVCGVNIFEKKYFFLDIQ